MDACVLVIVSGADSCKHVLVCISCVCQDVHIGCQGRQRVYGFVGVVRGHQCAKRKMVIANEGGAQNVDEIVDQVK